MSRRAMMGAVGVAALLVGCSESSDVATGPRYATSAPTASSCNITQTKADARAYFPTGVQTTVQALIKTMGDQYSAGNYAGARNTGFDIMTYVATAHRNGSAAGTAQDGSNLTNDLIGCMTVGVTGTINFAGALGPQGGYEVRGGTGDLTDAVRSLTLKSGLQPPTGTSFFAWVGSLRVLFYGAPKSNTFIVNDNAVGSAGFSWSTVPEVHALSAPGLFGLCVDQTQRDRVQEVNGTSGKILPLDTLAPFTLGLSCSSDLTVASRSGTLKRLAQFALATIKPEPAYAAALGGGTGGTLNGLSDFGVVDIVTIALTMDSVQDALTSQTIPTFHVTARSGGGTLLPSVDVTITVVGNSGSFVFTGTKTRTTDASGVATFNDLQLDKAGGYTLTASATTTGISTPTTVTSNLFHVKQ